MLKPKDIIALIKACGEAGVTDLSFGELKALFAPTPPVAKQTTLQDDSNVQVPPGTAMTFDPSNGFDRDEQLIKEQQMDLMLIENPAKYEELELAGDLEDAQAPRH